MPTETPNVLIELESFGGLRFPSLTYCRIETSWKDPVDKFEFGFVPRNGDKVGDPRLKEELLFERVKISVDGRDQVFGRIERSRSGAGPGELVLGGRGYISELLTCDVDPEVNIKEGMTLEQAIRLVAGPVGIANVRGEDQVVLRNIRTGRTLTGRPASPLFKVRPLKDYKPAAGGEKILAYIQRIVARHGVTVQPANDRNAIVLAQPDYAQEPMATLRRRFDGTGNNVLTSSAEYNVESIPTHVLFTGQEYSTQGGQLIGGNVVSEIPAGSRQVRVIDEAVRGLGEEFTPSAPNAPVPGRPVAVVAGELRPISSSLLLELPTPVVSRERIVTDRLKPTQGVKADEGLYRLMYRRDRDSKNLQQLNNAMIRAAAERRAKYLNYRMTINGHEREGGMFAINTKLTIDDEVEGVQQDLWVDRCVFETRGTEPGTTTRLTMLLPGAYIYAPM